MLNATKKPKENVIPLQRIHNDISPYDLEDIMEDLEDMGYLSTKGKKFRNEFWKAFIK